MDPARMFARRAMVLFVGAIVGWSTWSQAADDSGQFAIKGVGLLTCQDSVAARVAKSDLDIRFRSWIDGYLTAVNRYEPSTYDATPWGTPEIIATIVDNHCRDNPDERFVIAVQKLVATLQADKLTTSSPLLTVAVDGKRVLLYEALLQRVQERLAERGLYLGNADGEFGPMTQQAIALYQISEGLEGTGLPDPLTVWKLVKP